MILNKSHTELHKGFFFFFFFIKPQSAAVICYRLCFMVVEDRCEILSNDLKKKEKMQYVIRMTLISLQIQNTVVL